MLKSVPPVTLTLIILNIVVFLLQQVAGNAAAPFALWPLGSGLFHAWQLITYAFLHGSVAHIFLNMFALYMFGRSLETYWGSRRFIVYYLVCVLAAALTQLAVQNASGSLEPTLGASGGVFGILLAFGWYFPRQRLIILPIPIPLPAWLFVSLYALVELFFGLTGKQQDVAHFAHLGGMLGGAVCILYWRARQRLSS